MPDLDDALSNARRDLRAEAARIADTEATLDAIHRGQITSRAPSSNRARFIGLAAAIVLVIGGLVAVSWVTNDDADPAGPDPSIGPQPTATVPGTVAPTIPSSNTTPQSAPQSAPQTVPQTDAPTSSTSSTTPVVIGTPVSVTDIASKTFVDARHGWLIQNAPSSGSTSILQTVDGGGTWTQVTNLPSGILELHFADVTNGWAYDGTGLFSTHDGGATWTAMSGFGGQVGNGEALAPGFAISGDSVYVTVALDANFGIDRFGVTDDTVTQLDVSLSFGAGPVADLWVAAQPTGVWVVFNDRVVTGSARLLAGTVDAAWVPPSKDGGGPVFVHADPTGGPVWALAQTGIWSGDMDNPRTILYVSDDQGTTFRDVTPPGLGDDQHGFDIAVAGPTDIVAISRTDAGSTVLHSSDEGATWSPISDLAGVGLTGVQFVSPAVGFATVSFDNDGHQELWRTDDAGATWRPIAIAPAGT